MRATADHFKVLEQGPQYDALYIRSAVEVYRYGHNARWCRIAINAADRAMTNAARPDHAYLKTWDGRPKGSIGAPQGKLQTHAATAQRAGVARRREGAAGRIP